MVENKFCSPRLFVYHKLRTGLKRIDSYFWFLAEPCTTLTTKRATAITLFHTAKVHLLPILLIIILEKKYPADLDHHTAAHNEKAIICSRGANKKMLESRPGTWAFFPHWKNFFSEAQTAKHIIGRGRISSFHQPSKARGVSAMCCLTSGERSVSEWKWNVLFSIQEVHCNCRSTPGPIHSHVSLHNGLSAKQERR